jgi:hypothetical protein
MLRFAWFSRFDSYAFSQEEEEKTKVKKKKKRIQLD